MNSTQHEQILESFLSYCTPYRAASDWGQFHDPDAFLLPADPVAAWKTLAEKFRPDALRDSGLGVRGAGVELELNPILSRPAEVVLALRSSPDTHVRSLISAGGSLLPHLVPTLAALEVGLPLHCPQDLMDILFVARTIEDVAALRSMALWATHGHGLTTIIGEGLKVLVTGMGWGHAKNSNDDESGDGVTPEEDEVDSTTEDLPTSNPRAVTRKQLVFVDWAVSHNDECPNDWLSEIRTHFAQIERCLGYSLAEVAVWTPPETDRSDIGFTLRNGDISIAQRAIAKSIDDASADLLAIPAAAPAEAPPDLQTVISRFNESIRAEQPANQRKRIWEEYCIAVEREVITPLTAAAAKSRDPLRRSSLLAVAGSSRLLHHQIAILTARLARSVVEEGVDRATGVLRTELRDLLALMEQIGTHSEVGGEGVASGLADGQRRPGRRG